MKYQDRDHAGSQDAHADKASVPASPGKRTLTMPEEHGSAATPGQQTMSMALPIQRKPGGSANSPVGSDPPAAAASPSAGGGQPLPDELRGRMERLFGAGFADVRVHEGPQAESVGALAYTQGTDIHFVRSPAPFPESGPLSPRTVT